MGLYYRACPTSHHSHQLHADLSPTPPSMQADQAPDRVALACLQCRRRHIKCDATQPPCSRCRREGKECTYQASRRGGLEKTALAKARLKKQQKHENTTIHYRDDVVAAGTSYRSLHQVSCGTPSHLVANGSHLLQLYYEYCWSSFPMVLPYSYMQQRLERKIDHGLEALLAVMHWIGSLYTPFTASEAYYDTALQVLRQPTSTPFNVQALVLLAVAQHHCDQREAARTTLDRAIVFALRLGMNKQEFATHYGERDAVLEESWRRTYYNLYGVDQELSVVARILNFVLAEVVNTVDLPCDDCMYENGVSKAHMCMCALAYDGRLYLVHLHGGTMKTRISKKSNKCFLHSHTPTIFASSSHQASTWKNSLKLMH